MVLEKWGQPLLGMSGDSEKIQGILNKEFLKIGELPLKAVSSLTSFLWSSMAGLFILMLQSKYYMFKNQNENYKLKLVGGCVRKLITEEKIDDMDIAINIDPEKVKKVLIEQKIKFIETGIAHMERLSAVLINDFKFEITSLRKDVSTDGRHAKVEFTSNWEQDAQRRDFYD